MKLKFLINPKYIFLHALNQCQSSEPFKGWGKFTNTLWNKYQQEWFLLAGYPEWPLIKNESFLSISKKSEALLNKWLKTPQSKRLINETKIYCNWIEKEWNEKGQNALNELEKIIKLSLPNKSISVYITHPKLSNGFSVNNNIIAWGHRENWKNYSVVYLCHEIMHTILERSDFAHIAIELATDNELRIILNGRGKYFKEGKYDVGHPRLRKIEKKLLHEWKKYLKNPDINIKQFIKKISA